MGNTVKAMLSDDVGFKVDRTTGDVTIIARKNGKLIEKQIGGLDAIADENHAVVQIDGKEYVMLRMQNGDIVAAISHRTGNFADISTISGNDGEIAISTDKPAIAILNGQSNGAKFIKTWGSTRNVEVPSTIQPPIALTPDVARIVFTGEAISQTYSIDAGFEEGQTLELYNTTIGSPIIQIESPSVTIQTGAVAKFVFVNSTWKLIEFKFIGSSGATFLPNSFVMGMGAYSSFDDSIVIGTNAASENNAAIALGTKSVSMFDNSMTIGSGRSIRIAGKHEFTLGGMTIGANATTVLAFNGIGGEMEGEQPYWMGGVARVNVTVIGRKSNSSEWCRFVRQFDMYITNAGVHNITNVVTPSDSPDYKTANMSATNVTFSQGTYGLNINVFGSSTSMTTLWTAFVDTKFLRS